MNVIDFLPWRTQPAKAKAEPFKDTEYNDRLSDHLKAVDRECVALATASFMPPQANVGPRSPMSLVQLIDANDVALMHNKTQYDELRQIDVLLRQELRESLDNVKARADAMRRQYLADFDDTLDDDTIAPIEKTGGDPPGA